MPCELGAPIGSGRVDCYSMVGEYLLGRLGVRLPDGIGAVANSVDDYHDDPESVMDAIARLLRDYGCRQIVPYYHICGDILQLQAKRQYCTSPEDRVSHWGIDIGNANAIVAAMRHVARPHVRPIPLRLMSIVRAYRPQTTAD